MPLADTSSSLVVLAVLVRAGAPQRWPAPSPAGWKARMGTSRSRRRFCVTQAALTGSAHWVATGSYRRQSCSQRSPAGTPARVEGPEERCGAQRAQSSLESCHT